MSAKLRKDWKAIAKKWKEILNVATKISKDLDLTKDQEKIEAFGKEKREQLYQLAEETWELAKKDNLSKQIVALSFFAMFIKSMKDPNVWAEWMASDSSWWTDPEKLKLRLNAIKGKE